jgi:putative ABC transport system ATP-binding protein
MSDHGLLSPARTCGRLAAGSPGSKGRREDTMTARWERGRDRAIAAKGGDTEPMALRLSKVVKTYRQGLARTVAVDGVDLEVGAGEFVCIIGRSGSGKSTLLHLIAGLDEADEGEIQIGGVSIASLSDDELTLLRRRRIGIVFQFFNLLPALSAQDNVALPLILDGKRPADVRPRAIELLELVGLASRATHKPDQMSGGELQRVAIARALINEPVLLLADEPTGNLDSSTGQALLDLIHSVARDLHQTVLMVTHDLSAAERADRVVEFGDGKILDDRRPRSSPPS